MTTLRGGVRVQFNAYAQVAIPAYQAAGGSHQNAARDITNSLGALGTVDRVDVTLIPSLFGTDGFTAQCVFTPSSDVDLSAVDGAILYGANYATGVAQRVPTSLLYLQSGSTDTNAGLGGAVVPARHLITLEAYVSDPSSITTQITTDHDSAGPAINPVAGVLGGFTTQQSTDPKANGNTAAGTALRNIGNDVVSGAGLNWTEVEIIAAIGAGLAALVALAYVVRSVYRA